MNASAEITALASEAARALGVSTAATVIGEPVKVLAVELQGGERRGLVARVERRGAVYVVSLADLEAEGQSSLQAVIARYRDFLGIEPAPDAEAPSAEAPAASAELHPGASVEAVVLAAKESAARCRLVDGGLAFTLRCSGVWDLVPAEIAAVRVAKAWRHAGHLYASGEIEGSRLQVDRLGLPLLRLQPQQDWDPADEGWGGEERAVPAWARAIAARGPRPRFEMEQVIPGADPADWETDPIVEAAERHEAGDGAAARAILMEQLAGDLRCLDAHAHLGNHEFDALPKHAMRHYEAGVRIGELSLGAGFDGVLPWNLIDNRPFLRCLHGYGLCLWRLRQREAASEVLERLLWLNPSDDQGVRFLLDAIGAGGTWEEMEERGEGAPTGPR
jgi:hypothetical protein